MALRFVMNDNKTGLLMLLAAVFLWSTIEVVSKTLSHVPPVNIAFIRFSMGAVLLSPIWLRRIRDKAFRRAIQPVLPRLFISALVGISLTFTLFHYSLVYIHAYTAATIISSVPIFVLILSIVSMREKPDRGVFMGIFAGLFGIFILVWGDIIDLGRNLLGVFLALGAALCFSLFTVWNKRFSSGLGVGEATSISLAIGSLLFIPVMFVSGSLGYVPVGRGDWLALFYLGLAATGVGYALYFSGLQRIETHRGVSIFFIKPVISLCLAVLLIGEVINIISIAGILIVIASMYAVFFRR